MRNFDKYFEGYDVPMEIKKRTVAIMRRFSIAGLCDGMYIANVIAYHNKLGDGEGHFNGNIEIIDHQATAKQLHFAYDCNIVADEVEELRRIIMTGELNTRDTLYGLERYIRKCEEEKLTCDEWRREYLNREIVEANTTYAEVWNEIKGN